MSEPLVSIIIPTYNRAHLIGETLDSVLAQTYTHWECIVVDDGSTDSTSEILETYCKQDARFQYHHRPTNRAKGANACRNYGFELSKGEYINWFDDDDVMLKDFIKVKLKAFNEINELVVCAGLYTDENLKYFDNLLVNRTSNIFLDYLLWNLQLVTNSVLFKKSFIKNKPLFNTKLTRGQEEDFFSRIFFKLPSNSCEFVSKPLFLYRQHSKTITFKNKNYILSNKESEAYVYLENFKRLLELKEQGPLKTLYLKLLDLFFRGLENNHFLNSKYILENLYLVLSGSNKKLSYEIFMFGTFLIFIKRGSYRIERRWKHYKIESF